MTALALFLVLTAAVLHATWNLAAKRVGSGLPFVFGVGVIMTVIYTPILIGMAVWRGEGLGLGPTELGVIAVSTVLKTGYALYLQRAYRSGDFSFIYPLVRGSAPLIATAGAVIFLGERPSSLGLMGGALIVVSIFFLSNGERLWQRSADPAAPRLGRALGNALIAGSFIASYTVWDRNAVGFHDVNPVVFDGLTNIGLTLLLAPFAWSRRTAVREIWRVNRREMLIMATLSPLAYVLVLTALSFTPVSYVAPAREFSILIGAYLGARVFREQRSARRLWCALGMVIGLIALAAT
ncbi:DMT family transporter [Synoicihabitans lomoniglobus]|uniref:DMT family transporter n=1 Tax=Synoicihabitans lomoniglobus TaxID=2909285 RepID=A0AAE9ZVC2_9BACT|nr:DMT family transporter [Opitutaceae bacterium LMO-M01]WED63804.1 DMT family transporter [Opitutaceae bacterium LMO-M01]